MYTAALVRVLPLVALCLAAPNPTPVQDRKPTRVGSIERRENTCTAAPPKDPPLSALDNPDPEQTYEFVQLTVCPVSPSRIKPRAPVPIGLLDVTAKF